MTNIELLNRKLRQEERHLDDLIAACAPPIVKDHQGGRVAALKDVIAWLSEQRQLVP